MPKLNDLHAILLATAAGRADGSLYPMPESLAKAGARLIKAVASLSKAGLAEERETSNNAAAFRVDGDLCYGLFINAAGLAAIGASEAASDEQMQPAMVIPAVQTSKAGAVLALLQRDRGATLADLIAATGWLPHTTRAALTGLRKKGHAVERTRREGTTCYRIVAAA